MHVIRKSAGMLYAPVTCRLGYRHAGIDDGWQECDSYTVEPSGSPACLAGSIS